MLIVIYSKQLKNAEKGQAKGVKTIKKIFCQKRFGGNVFKGNDCRGI